MKEDASSESSVYTQDTDEDSSSVSSDDGPARGSKTAETSSAVVGPSEADKNHGVKRKHASKIERYRKTKLAEQALEKYRQLLDDGTSDGINSGFAKAIENDPLPRSRFGASVWHSGEMEALLAHIPVHGSANLGALSRILHSKAEPEISACMIELQESVAEMGNHGQLREMISVAEIPAAYEVGVECDEGLDVLAGRLEGLAEQQAANIEQTKHGNHWLIDRDFADYLEQEFEITSETANPNSQSVDHESGGSGTESDKWSSPKGNGEHLPETTSVEGRGNERLFPSARLLRPAAFLDLSSKVFMNGNVDLSSRFDQLVKLSGGNCPASGPAFHRSAFDDIYDLAVSITRRLVQASIFQAMTRLRAVIDDRTRSGVRKADVDAALDVLGMRTMRGDREAYWAKVIRRYGIDVYSSSNRFKDGRPGRRHGGVKLTEDEADMELGVQISDRVDEQIDLEGTGFDDLEFDSGTSTETSTDDSHPIVRKSSAEAADEEPFQKRHRREVSPRAFDRVEDEYLEVLDQQKSREEELRLWELLGRDNVEEASTPSPLPEVRPVQKPESYDWRDDVHYQAEWEQDGPPVSSQEFRSMHVLGEGRRKRRKLMRERIHSQDASGAGHVSNDRSDADTPSHTRTTPHVRHSARLQDKPARNLFDEFPET